MRPSIKTLAEEWSVSTATVEKALRVLREEQLVKGIHGIGTEVVRLLATWLVRERDFHRLVIDPAAHYGVDIIGLSPEIKAIQMYAPTDKQFVAIEHQYNFGDPFGKEWGSTNTGMVTLKPGQTTRWHVRLHVFVP